MRGPTPALTLAYNAKVHSDDPSLVYEKLAARLRQERRRQGLTLEALAASAGISTGFLGYIEQGRRKPSLVTIAHLARALDVSLPRLFDMNPKVGPSFRVPAEIQSIFRQASARQRGLMFKVLKALAAKDS